MKNFKKIASAIAALSLAACVAVPMSATVFTASAAETTGSITINDNIEGYEYYAYQIFVGDESDGTLSNIEWGSGVETDSIGAMVTAIQGIDIGTEGSSNKPFTDKEKASDIAKVLSDTASPDKTRLAEEFAKVVSKYLSETKTPLVSDKTGDGTSHSKYSASTVKTGYYLVRNEKVATGGSYTNYILKVVDDAEANPKRELPTFDKKIKDVDESGNETEGNGTWKDSADHDIQDKVDFQLKATLPENYADYTTYKLVFHDNFKDETSGKEVFTFDKITAVYIDTDSDGDSDVTIPVTSGYTSKTEGITDGCNLEIEIANLKTLLDNEAFAAAENPTVYVEYTATLNENAVIGSTGNWNEAYLEYSNNPNYTGDSDSDEGNTTEKTPKETVVTFTYKLNVDKIGPAESGGTQPLAGAAFTLYKYSKTDENWVEVEAKTADDTTTAFTFSGIDAGMYKLVETKTPNGYNSIDDMYFLVEATHTDSDSTSELTALDVYALTGADHKTKGSKISGSELSKGITFTSNVAQGLIDTDVLNEKGAVLPSTGGIGTTLFYLGGGALVAVAGVMLITKKRMTKE